MNAGALASAWPFRPSRGQIRRQTQAKEAGQLTHRPLAIPMQTQPIGLFFLAALLLFPPSSAFGSRTVPKPVPPVVWQGVEYRAPLDSEHMGHVQAFDLASGQMLWETEVYRVRIDPSEEQDVQWVFVSSMTVQDGKLLVRNEAGDTFKLDLATGQLEGGARYWLPWALGGVAVLSVILLCYWAWRRRAR